jgi:hypothetical protein
MSSRPTESASIHFQTAKRYSASASKSALVRPSDVGEFNMSMATAVNELASGLIDLTNGLRATYLLTEKLEREIRELKGQLR